jgi:hypothetical protein
MAHAVAWPLISQGLTCCSDRDGPIRDIKLRLRFAHEGLRAADKFTLEFEDIAHLLPYLCGVDRAVYTVR